MVLAMVEKIKTQQSDAKQSDNYFNSMSDKLQEGTVKYGAGNIKHKRPKKTNIKNGAKKSVRNTKELVENTVQTAENIGLKSLNTTEKITKNTVKNSNRTASKTVRRGKTLTRNVTNNAAEIVVNTLNSGKKLTHNVARGAENIIDNTINAAVGTTKNVITNVRNIVNNGTDKKRRGKSQKRKTHKQMNNNNRHGIISGGTAYNNPPPNPMSTSNYLSFTGNSSPQGPTDAIPIQMAASSKKNMQPYVQAMNSSANGIVSNAAPFSVVSEEHTGGAKKKE